MRNYSSRLSERPLKAPCHTLRTSIRQQYDKTGNFHQSQPTGAKEQQPHASQLEGSTGYLTIFVTGAVRRGYIAQTARSQPHRICRRFIRGRRIPVSERSPIDNGGSADRVVQLSIMEAECIADCEGAKNLAWGQLLTELQITDQSVTLPKTDSEGAYDLLQTKKLLRRSRHIIQHLYHYLHLASSEWRKPLKCPSLN